MLADGKIDSLDTHLEQFKLHDQNRQIDLTNLLREYGQLLDEYRDLKKAYAESSKRVTTKPAVTPTTAATTKPQNSHVLVLIDGNNYIFNDEFLREKEEGGMRAARMLNEAIEKYLQQSAPQACTARIYVKIYADLTNLSKQLARSKVIGFEKRSLSPFSAAFTRAISLFDFIDALDEEGTKFKIREQFKIASEDTSCSHILYAACHDLAYLSQLVPFSGLREKITLVQGARWNPEFHQFNLNVTQFPTIFRWSELSVAPPAEKFTATTAPKQKAVTAVQRPILKTGLATPRKESWRRNGSFSVSDSAFGDLSPSETNGFNEQDRVGWEERSAYTQTVNGGPSKPQKDSQLCKYFQKGSCRFGNKCNFQHVQKGLDDVNASTPSSSQAYLASLQPSQLSIERTNISSMLPAAPIPGFIPLNKSQQRIDPALPFPSSSAWKIYNARFAKAKPCNTFHLQQRCSSFNCSFDHSDLEPEAKQVLEYVVRCNPCPRKGECRKRDCFYGHLCQKDGCDGQGGQGPKACRFKTLLHYRAEECKVASLVPAEVNSVAGDGVGMGGVELVDGENLMMW
ncbi:hypothetical protein G6011_05211 [Alternaria panax]|uniref:C3H1-type domain-containing protein n=1 Tax=Alternaria panax TaxID=48097 RepID=A0AAD4FDD0_9PLEO|nr:hypothetical protein G6011_05211 [Alternaria panax]